ncbi:MAG: hypothetical protein K8S98_07700 [Planctomycetes bacterium]|nr:hypothetical protein [Planctomycetota bacterium]
MTPRSLGLLATAQLAISIAGCAHVETRESTARTPSVQVETAKPIPAPEQRYFLIRDEVQALAGKHPWAGIYTSAGTDTSDEFLVAPHNGWVSVETSVGGRHFQGAGEVREVGDWLAFEFVGMEAHPYSGRMRLPIHWGDRRYLLQSSRLKYFINAVNSGAEREFPMRSLDMWGRDNVPTGLLELPPGIAESIFDPPLVVSAIRVEPTHGAGERLHAAVVLDAGRNRGVFVGMCFYPDRTDAPFGTLNVISVDEGTCVTRCWGSTHYIPIEAGSRFSSAPPERWASQE